MMARNLPSRTLYWLLNFADKTKCFVAMNAR